jgi:hypothetical protein
MVVKWDGEAPPDRSAWHEVLGEALGEDAGFHWVRFYKEPEGWRFDLQRRTASGTERVLERADESVALNVYTQLVENGMPLDPGWRPSAPSPPAPRVRRAPVVAPSTPPAEPVALPSEQVALPAEPVPLPVEPARPPAEPAPAAEPAPPAEPVALAAEPATLAAEPVVLPDTLPGAEAAPAPQSEDRAAEGPPTSGRRRRGRHRRRRAPALPEPASETLAEPVGATLFDAALAPQPLPLTARARARARTRTRACTRTPADRVAGSPPCHHRFVRGAPGRDCGMALAGPVSPGCRPTSCPLALGCVEPGGC